MEVSGINTNSYPQPQTEAINTAPAVGAGAQDTKTEQTAFGNGEAGVYEKSGKTYNIDKKAVAAAIEEANNQGEKLRSLVTKLLGQQGNEALKATGFKMDKEFFEKLQVDDETRAAAEAALGEDGYWGVKKTSERILDFAKALSGGDPSKIELLRDAVKKGFAAAEKDWGDKLPDISYQTLDAVMKGFDDWAAASAKEPAAQ